MGEHRRDDRTEWEGELFRLLVENVVDYAIFIVDPEGRVRSWSHGAGRLLGYREEDVLGESAERFFTPEDVRDGVPRREMEEALATGRGADDRWHVRKDGTRFWVSGSMTPLRDEAGTLRGFAKIMRDRTDWWHAEQARREGEVRTAAILEAALDGIITIDHAGRVIEFNPAAERTFGYARADATGREMAGLIIPPSLREAHREGLARYLVTGEGPVVGRRIEIIAMRADGSEFPVELAITRISTGGPPLFTAHVRDITDRKRREEEVAEQGRLADFHREIGLALIGGRSLQEMLDRCAEVTVRRLDGAFARIWTADEAGETLELRASAGIYTHTDGPHARVPVGRYKIGMIARDRRPHLSNSVIGDPRVPAQDWAEREGMVAFAGYPLVVGDRLIGVWAMFARHPLSETTLQAMASVANGIALGVERLRAAEALARSEAWLATTLASIGDAVIATDERGLVRFMNPVAEALTGWPKAEAAGRPMEEVFRIVDEHTRKPAEHPVARVLREGVVVSLANHTVLIARGGAETPIEDSAAPIRGDAGLIVGVVMVFRDVTEEQAAQRRIRESEERFRTLAESIPQLAWMARPDGHIYWYNKRWHDYTGTTPEEMDGWGWQKVHDPAYLPSVMERWMGSIASGEPFDMVFPLRGADGTFRPFLTRVMPVRGEDGKVAHWFGTNTDIADRQRFEDELKVAKEEAEAANRAKTQFLAVLSHELRAPLNPILLAASSMLDRPTPPEDLRPTMEMIRNNVNLQARLIDDLLDVMRIVRGKMPLHWGVVDCHEVISRAIQVCQSDVFGKSIRPTFDLAAGRHHVNADAARLQQVFWNLIKNAVKFSPEGGSLAIRTRNEGDDRGSLVIEVADTGIGIEPDVLHGIFDPFQQGETTITRRFGGLGLGLAICRGVVEAHGGTIVAESGGKGRGTTFRIALDVLPDSAAAEGDGRPIAAPAATGVDAPPAGSLKILVVEDEPATQRLMARLLRGLGHEVTTAGTIAEATEATRSVDFDLIISDIGLPDGSGLDVIRRVVARRGPVPAIALTGYGMEEDIVRSREAGFTAHMTKPIDFTKLEAMIGQVARSRL